VKPRYTDDAMRLRIQGSVWVECVVLPDGTVGDLRVMRSLDSRFGLDDEAIAAAKKWRFRPGTLNGKPVPVVVSIELMFSLR
jgi:protein TonB